MQIFDLLMDLLNNVKDHFEPIALGYLEQLKQGCFHAGYFGACVFTLFQSDLFIFEGARRNRIGNKLNTVCRLRKISDGLIHTNMGFDSGDQDVRAVQVFEGLPDFIIGVTAKAVFRYRLQVR